VLAKPSTLVSKYVVRRGSAEGQPPQGCCGRLLGAVGTVGTSPWPICHHNNDFMILEMLFPSLLPLGLISGS